MAPSVSISTGKEKAASAQIAYNDMKQQAKALKDNMYGVALHRATITMLEACDPKSINTEAQLRLLTEAHGRVVVLEKSVNMSDPQVRALRKRIEDVKSKVSSLSSTKNKEENSVASW